MFLMRRICGIVLISMGTGMLIVLVVPGWGFIFAAVMVIVGYWALFMC